jgi:glucose-1-phosphate thymidylyltransferase
MKAIIAAGGHATRLRPITYTLNKHLIPLANKPLLWYAIEKLAEVGVKEIGINVNPGEVEIQRICGDGSMWGVTLTYIEQVGGATGIGRIPLNAEAFLGHDEPFIYYLGDNIILGSLHRFVEKFEREHLDCLLALSKVNDPQRFGVPELRDGRIVRVLEKPKDPPSDFAVTGIYVYGPSYFEAARSITPSARGEYEISDVHTWLIEHGREVGYEEITGWWKDTGKPEDLIIGNGLIMDLVTESSISPDLQKSDDVRIEGIAVIGEDVVLDRGTVLHGPANIADGCRISGSHIGPHVSIGANAIIKDATISESIVMDGTEIEGGPKITNSMFGRNVRARTSTKPGSSIFFVGDQAQIEW